MAARSDRPASPAAAAGSTGETPLVLTRVFDAPRELVFQAWTDPRQVAQWWGPHGFTNPRCELDARPGGQIRIDMRGPDGVVYPMTGSFTEVAPPQRLVFVSAVPDAAGKAIFEVLTTVTFTESGGRTTQRMEARVTQRTAAAEQYIRGMDAGWTQTLERLADHVADAAAAWPTEEAFVLTRTFDAARELVFKAWTEPERLSQWFGPKGFTMPTCRMDLRPGGVFHYQMKSPDGHAMWGKWTFREIVPPQRIVCVVSFSDEQGGVARHPMSAQWPLETLSETTFAEHEGKTIITIRWSALNASEAERKTFASSHDGMRGGWSGTMEQLAEYLAKARA
jgi:uncharacterized protein YndB with AHSA1/START domain